MPIVNEDILSVPYNIPGSQYWQWVDIYTRLNQERIIFLNQPITDSLANSIISALLYLESSDQGKPIYLYINSAGDPVEVGMADETLGMMSVMGGLAIYDTIQHIKSEVITICLGQSIGMATLLLSSGMKGKRASLPHSTIVLSNPQMLTQGQATDIQIGATELLSKQRSLLELLAKNTGQTVEKLHEDTQRTFYLTPQQALEYGLIDKVLTSNKAGIPSPAVAV